jgi:hypothetical protein
MMDDLEQIGLIDRRRAHAFLRRVVGTQQGPKEPEARVADTHGQPSDLFMYVNKLPTQVAERLEQLGVIRARQDGHYSVRSRQDANRLMSVAVNHSFDGSDTAMIPDAGSDSALWQSAMPVTPGAGIPATAVSFPLVTPLRDVPVDQLIEFRLKDANEALRRDYLSEVAKYVRKRGRSDSSDEQRATLAGTKVAGDMELAATSLSKRFGRAGLTIGFTAVTAIMPRAHELDNAAEVLAGAAQVGAAAVGATKDLELRHPHKYLRVANRAGLLPHA